MDVAHPAAGYASIFDKDSDAGDQAFVSIDTAFFFDTASNLREYFL